jgi:hypothetical protein
MQTPGYCSFTLEVPCERPGQKALIAVRVEDWVGAGGIFRPVTLGTLAFNPALDLLK